MGKIRNKKSQRKTGVFDSMASEVMPVPGTPTEYEYEYEYDTFDSVRYARCVRRCVAGFCI